MMNFVKLSNNAQIIKWKLFPSDYSETGLNGEKTTGDNHTFQWKLLFEHSVAEKNIENG